MSWLFKLTWLISLCFSCTMKRTTEIERNGIHYFKSWATYEIPFRPIDEISQENALKLKSYYIGYYTNNILLKFEKYLDNQLHWQDLYIYWPNTKILQKREMHHFDPTAVPYRVQNFDKKGNFIKE